MRNGLLACAGQSNPQLQLGSGYNARLTHSFGYLNQKVPLLHSVCRPLPLRSIIAFKKPSRHRGWSDALSSNSCAAHEQGYCVGSTCQRFPVTIGEFGSRLRDCRNGCASRQPNCMSIDLKVRLCTFRTV